MTFEEAIVRDAGDPLAFARERFLLPDDTIYLDGNSLGALPKATAERLAQSIKREWGTDLIKSWTLHEWIDWPLQSAAKLAPLIGAESDELIWADSTTINLAKLAMAAVQASGRRIVVTEARNFPTDRYVAQGLAALLPEIELRTVEREELEAALDDDVALLMLTHVDYRSGERHDARALSAAARDAGALSLWDLSHSAGALACDLHGWGADLAVGCGYKYLNGGPGAPAWLYVRRDLQERLGNPLPGWMGHEAPFAFDGDYRPADGIRRFLTGTPPILGLAAVTCGLDTFEGVQTSALEEKAGALGDQFIAEVEARCPSLVLASPRQSAHRGAQVAFAHPDAYAIMQALIERGVIGDFRAPDLVRFGFAPLYVRFEEVLRAVEVLEEVMIEEAYRDPRFSIRKSVT